MHNFNKNKQLHWMMEVYSSCGLCIVNGALLIATLWGWGPGCNDWGRNAGLLEIRTSNLGGGQDSYTHIIFIYLQEVVKTAALTYVYRKWSAHELLLCSCMLLQRFHNWSAQSQSGLTHKTVIEPPQHESILKMGFKTRGKFKKFKINTTCYTWCLKHCLLSRNLFCFWVWLSKSPLLASVHLGETLCMGICIDLNVRLVHP